MGSGLVDVALTPAQAGPVDVAVVVDALRATSTVAQALAAGYRRVLCASLLNLDAVAEWLARACAPGGRPDVCAGIKG
ncbi:MAG: 2-phosphosulfolactate phosphatase, partial [Solirubrobacteraceae bacterium]